MKKFLMNKKNITGVAIIVAILLCMTGCNKETFDFNYTFDKAICNIGGTYHEFKIDKWTDYEGEQIQLTDKEGNVYLVNSVNCTLIKED